MVRQDPPRRTPMLYWTLIFLVVAIVAGVLGFGGIATAAAHANALNEAARARGGAA